ncbi:hypothetical protein GCM10022228_14450 [Halomonas cibimaris]|uniref:Cell division protein ZapE n=1 Tax=Halomonas cibimaris TaxID=657012 RepID=A0ABP7LQK6_9GAMM
MATSNSPPDELYYNGLQRARFLPAIALLKQHCEVLRVDSNVDYRLRTLSRAEVFYTPLGKAADQALMQRFQALADGEEACAVALDVNGRTILARRLSGETAWFEFHQLCDGPRSQNDYIELARRFHTVLLANVPQMGALDGARVRRFINLVDEFYDRGVNVLMSAETPLASLYTGGRLDFEFRRTRSRLEEMQSRDYLALPHRP